MILRTIGGNSEVVLQELKQQFGAEHLYTWSGYNHYQDWAILAYSRAIASGKKIICAETPLIGRDLFDQNDIKTYFRIGINSVSTQQFKNFNIPAKTSVDRLCSILDATKTTIKSWRKNGEHILYAMQVPADSSLSGLDIFAAAQYDLVQIRQITNRPIIITLHPDLQKEWGMDNFKKNNQNFEKFKVVASVVGAKLQIGGSKDALENCWCTVCYTSGFGFDSMAEGVPVITLSQRNFIAPISGNNLYEIDDPHIPSEGEMMDWLSRIAYCQWTIDEIRSGLTKNHLESLL
jgi:hypothetical protein